MLVCFRITLYAKRRPILKNGLDWLYLAFLDLRPVRLRTLVHQVRTKKPKKFGYPLLYDLVKKLS